MVREGGRVELMPIVIGKDYGTEVEVISGLRETDNVIDQIRPIPCAEQNDCSRREQPKPKTL